MGSKAMSGAHNAWAGAVCARASGLGCSPRQASQTAGDSVHGPNASVQVGRHLLGRRH